MAAAAAADGPATDVPAVLEGYEWSAARAARDLSAGDRQRLMRIAASETALNLYRQRATATLGELGGAEVMSFLASRLAATGDAVDRRRLADTLCAGFAETRPGEVERLMVSLLDAEDGHLRARAAQCLRGPAFGADVAPALERYRAGIEHSWEARAAGFEQR